jgi:catechol 2,3-dioxygenase-like lactoylglutathione lyase family enzyme
VTKETSGPLLRFQALCLDTDAAHLEQVAAFWSTALGWEREPGHSGAVLRGARPGESLWIDVVPEPRTVKHRTHLDVRVEDVETLLAAGARIDDATSFPWAVLRDPEEGELCAFPVPEGRQPGLYEVCTDCGPDAEPITRWWAEVLGGEVRRDEGDDWAYVTQPEGAPFELWVFCPVPEPKAAKNRFHLDFRAARRDAVEHLVARGAAVLREPDDEIGWHVLADPDGNEFCVFAPEQPGDA